MGDHRIHTDRSQTTVIGGCPNGCQAFEITLKAPEGDVSETLEEVSETFDTCPHCGEPLGTAAIETPTTELE